MLTAAEAEAEAGVGGRGIGIGRGRGRGRAGACLSTQPCEGYESIIARGTSSGLVRGMGS